MEKNIKKLLKILICIVIILSVIMFIIYFINKDKIETESRLNYINNDEKWNDEVQYPVRASVLVDLYDGEMTIKDIGKSMYYFTVEILPKYYLKLKNLNSDEISTYYRKHIDIIAKDIGIENEEEFKKFIISIQTLNTDKLILDKFVLEKDSTEMFKDYTNTILKIQFKNENEIRFNVKIYNGKKENVSSLVYTAIDSNE